MPAAGACGGACPAKNSRANKGKVIEAYPTVPKSKNAPPVSSYMGFPSIFEKVGFVECAKPSKSKRIMRFTI